jgi:hypothetical protein
MLEIVRGVQTFLNTEPENAEQLKDALRRSTDSDTKAVIGAMKAT